MVRAHSNGGAQTGEGRARELQIRPVTLLYGQRRSQGAYSARSGEVLPYGPNLRIGTEKTIVLKWIRERSQSSHHKCTLLLSPGLGEKGRGSGSGGCSPTERGRHRHELRIIGRYAAPVPSSLRRRSLVSSTSSNLTATGRSLRCTRPRTYSFFLPEPSAPQLFWPRQLPSGLPVFDLRYRWIGGLCPGWHKRLPPPVADGGAPFAEKARSFWPTMRVSPERLCGIREAHELGHFGGTLGPTPERATAGSLGKPDQDMFGAQEIRAKEFKRPLCA